MRAFATALLIVLCAGAAARAQDLERFGLAPADVKRLEGRAASRSAAMAEAEKGGKPKDRAMLRELMGAKPLPIADAKDLAGRWRCRIVKIGGLLPLTPYGFFNCVIEGGGDKATFEKTSGSQRTGGDLMRRDPESFVYRGVGFTDFVTRKPYGDGPDTDQVALAYRIGRNRLRLEFPAPRYESKYDVMELVRAR